ncbi:MAG: hypothetical protein GY870_12780, partial [archaeon]|nr:hypothetical protein [archaeon]
MLYNLNKMLEKYETKLSTLSNTFKKKKVLIALSGGVDSTLVLLCAMKYAQKIIPVFFKAPIMSNYELDETSELCLALKIQLEVVDINPIENPEFKINPINRCYICKKMIMGALLNIKKELQYDEIAEGTNLSEIENGKHRPGYQALKELDILSPLIIAKFQKKDIRELIGIIKDNISEFLGEEYNSENLRNILNDIQKKPSNPCLCSRVEYNIPIDQRILQRIDEAEFFL